MYPFKKTNARAGTTLMELTVAIFITSVVVTGVYRIYRFVTISTDREKQKAELQQQIITVSNLIERDIRMAGCGLPGNGVSTHLVDTTNYHLSCYSNELRRQTTLSVGASSSDTRVIVADGTGFSTNGYVCLAEDGRDTVYRKINAIGIEGSGFDTLYLSMSIYHCNFTTGATVYPATKVSYWVTTGSPKQIKRYRNNIPIKIGTKLDSILVVLKNAAGNPVGASVDDAAMVTVVVGGHVGTGGNRVFMAESTEVNIRNVN